MVLIGYRVGSAASSLGWLSLVSPHITAVNRDPLESSFWRRATPMTPKKPGQISVFNTIFSLLRIYIPLHLVLSKEIWEAFPLKTGLLSGNFQKMNLM
jgi:hypothetical protein